MVTGLDLLSDVIIYSKYAKYIPELKRRETWNEIVYRYLGMMTEKYPQLTNEIYLNGEYIFDKKVLPSMRALQFAGEAIKKNPVRLYNCSYLPIDDITAFSEVIFLLLSGVGVGYSIQYHHIDKLPEIIKPIKERRFLVGDSLEGWSDSIKVLIKSYFGKQNWKPAFDYSDIRPKGTRLVTAGGKAPGPEPLKICHAHIEAILDRFSNGDKLKPIDAHDICCHLANAVLAGGIRRAAMISLFSFDDEDMISCKHGNWWEGNEQRGRSNNSAVIDRKRIKYNEFKEFFKKIELSKSGEPGIYLTNNIEWGSNPCCFTGDTLLLTKDGYQSFKKLSWTNNSLYQAKERNIFINKDNKIVPGRVWSNGYKQIIILHFNNKELKCTPDHKFMLFDGSEEIAQNLIGKTLKGFDNINHTVTRISLGDIEEVFDFSLEDDTHWGVVEGIIAHNCEISLRPFQTCNLCEINVDDIESQEDLNKRSEIASFFGTLQAGFSDFHYLRDVWKRTVEKDALLGVSMTGIASNKVNNLNLEEAATVVVNTNEKIANIININKSARLTCVKPAGTSSCVLKTSSGIHAWHNDYYVRRIRLNKNESIFGYLNELMPELMEDDMFRPKTQSVFKFPIKSPNNSILRDESPIESLERVKRFNVEWIETGHINGDNRHNVSCTINVKDNEWSMVRDWVWSNINYCNGISFLPYDGGTYVQAPFEDCTKEIYQELSTYIKDIDLSLVIEEDDNTDLKGEAACSAGGSCEIKSI